MNPNARMIHEAFISAVPEREAIARLLEPNAWKLHDHGFTHSGREQRERSLFNADAIISLFNLNSGIAEAIAEAMEATFKSEQGKQI